MIEASPKYHAVEVDDSHRIAVFDINVWLEVAKLLGPGAGANRRRQIEETISRKPFPNSKDSGVDSFRAWQYGASGVFAGPLRLRVLISDEMLRVLFTKLVQSMTDHRKDYRGLGWNTDEADDFLRDAVLSFAKAPDGSTFMEPLGPELCPPLDREDGMVLAAVRAAGAHYLVTNDRTFAYALEGRKEYSHTLTVFRPHSFVRHVAIYRRLAGDQPR